MSRYIKGSLNDDGTSIYDHLNEKPIAISIIMDELARKLVWDEQEGITRLFAAIIRERKKKLTDDIARYNDCGDDDVAEHVRQQGDPVIEALEKLMRAGVY